MNINYMFTETKRARSLSVGLAIFFAILLFLGLQSAEPADAATRLPFVVNSTGDANDLDFQPLGTFDGSSDGKCDVSSTAGDQCTLRAAIQAANKKKGKDTIAFNIPTTGVATISPGSPLPTITKPVTIDGYTQSGATENTETQPGKTNASPKIELDGTIAGGVNVSGLEIKASNAVVRGLVINSFGLAGIRSSGGTGNRIEGNFIGTDPSGTVDLGNNYGVLFDNTDNSTIGGTSHEARNLVSGNNVGVPTVNGTSGNKIQGNLIGTDKNGTADLGTDVWGVFVSTSCHNNTIGDSDPTDGATNASNTIAFHSEDGVFINSGSTGNRILSNSIFSNGALGIDLFGGDETIYGFGVTANDPDDPNTSKPDPDKDIGANNLQNYPVLSSAQTGGFTSINGTLESTPSTRKKKSTFIIQFFSSPAADPSGFGEGQTFLDQTQVTTDASGNASFSFAPFQAVPVGKFITATATNKRTGDTSEFSQARVVTEPGIGT